MQRHLMLVSTLLVFASKFAAGSSLAADRLVWTGPGFTATYIENIAQSGQQGRNRLWVSARGVRSELAQAQTGKSPVAIVNFARDSVWIVLPWLKSYAKAGVYSAMFRKTDTPRPRKAKDRRSGGNFIPVRVERACHDVDTARSLGKVTFDGRTLEKWECGPSKNPAARVTRIYDATLQLIVREEDRQGNYFELRDVRAAEPEEALFSVPADYREVSAQQLFQQPRAQLPAYSGKAR